MRNYKNLSILGVNFSAVSRSELLETISKERLCSYALTVLFSNVSCIVEAYNNTERLKIINASDINAVDGMPISWIAHLVKLTDSERCAGPDIMEDILRSDKEGELRHFFFGSTDETLIQLKLNINKKYPKAKIVGMYSPPFCAISVEEDNKICNEIQQSKPDYVWVGLGAKKQDDWIINHKDRFSNCALMGVGAAFDFHANIKSRAPLFFRDHGLEWLFRLAQEPQRLWSRYLVGNFKFIYYIIINIRTIRRI
ncbi:glycosyl transferase [Clostridia bacterium]|nr:glycosyl transferase [Clostridia bacterium]